MPAISAPIQFVDQSIYETAGTPRAKARGGSSRLVSTPGKINTASSAGSKNVQ
jgi:hypothetical protein